MTDTAAGALAVVIAFSHAALLAVAWAWAARSRHPGFLVLVIPTAVAWAVAGFPLIRALTYGTHPWAAPQGGLQTAGFTAVIVGFGSLAVAVAGIAVTLAVRAVRSRGRRRRQPIESA